jgi:hypothetical protein
MHLHLCEIPPILNINLFSGCNEFPIYVLSSKFLLVNKVVILLQVFFAQLMLTDMNKDLKGLRFLTQLFELFKDSHTVPEVDSMV